MFLVRCAGISNLWHTPTPSTTPFPTATLTPTTTPTITPTATPTPIIPAGIGTPLPGPRSVISAQNADQLVEYAQWGKGIPQQLAWSPDGSLLAVASTQGLYFYAGETLEEIGAVENGIVFRCLAFSPDGEIVATGTEDGKVYLWRVEDGTLVGKLKGHKFAVLSVAFSSDGGLLASGSWDRTIRLWRVDELEIIAATEEDQDNDEDDNHEIQQDSRLLATLEGHLAGVRGVAFSPDGTTLYSWSRKDPINVWSVQGGDHEKTLYIGQAGGGLTATGGMFSTDGELFAAAQSRQVRIFRTKDGTTLSVLKPFGDTVQEVTLSDDGQFAATSEKGRIKIWRTNKGELIQEYELPVPGEKAHLLALSPDGKVLVTLGKALDLWMVGSETGPQFKMPMEYSSEYRFFSTFSADGSAVLAATMDGGISSYGILDGDLEASTSLPETLIGSMALSPDQTIAAYGTGDRKVLLWQVQGSEVLHTFKGYKKNVISLAFSPDGTLLATGSGDLAASVWNVEDGELEIILDSQVQISEVAFSPDGELLAGISNGIIQIWTVSDWALLHTIEGSSIVFSPKGNILAVEAIDTWREIITIRKSSEGDILQTLDVSGGSVAFSRDEKILALAGRSITLWNMESGEMLLEMDSPTSYGEIFFSPDGRMLALSAWDGVLTLWGVPD